MNVGTIEIQEVSVDVILHCGCGKTTEAMLLMERDPQRVDDGKPVCLVDVVLCDDCGEVYQVKFPDPTVKRLV